MKKKISVLLVLALVCLSCVALLIGCGDNSDSEALQLYLLEEDNQTVTEEFILPKQIADNDVTWTSDKENIVITERDEDYLASVVRPDSGTVEVTLTVTLGKASKSFTVRVKGIDVYDIADSYSFSQNKQTVYPGEFELDSSYTENTYGKTATISWEVPSDCSDYIKIEDGKCVVTYGDADSVNVRLVATFTYAGETATKTYKFVVSGSKSLKDLYLAEVIDSPEAGTAYKLGLYQANSEKVLYATGEMSGNYLAMTEDVSAAADAVLEATTGGYFLKLGSKYVTLTAYLDGSNVKGTLSLEDSATTVFTVGEDDHILYADVTADGTAGTLYLGTYYSYNTISASSTYYITGDNAAKIDVSQFPARLVSSNKIEYTSKEPETTEAEEVTISKALEIGGALEDKAETSGEYQLTGILGEITNTTYGNSTLIDSSDSSVVITVYGMYDETGANRFDAMSSQPKAGDTVTLVGKLKKYGETIEIVNAKVVAIAGEAEEVTISKALEIGGALENKAETSGEYQLTGILGEITNSTYGNSTLIDSSDSSVVITVYGMYDETGSTRYDAMSNAPKAGDTVTLIGKLKKYGDTIEIINAKVVGGKGASDDSGSDSDSDSDDSTMPDAATGITVDFSGGTDIAVTKTGEYTNYDGATATGGIQKVVTINGVTVTNDIGSSTNEVTVKYDTAENGSVRFYAKSTLTIAYSGITKITFTTKDKNFGGSEALSVEGAEIHVDGTTATITFTEPVDSITITLTAQVRIVSLVVSTDTSALVSK